VNPPPPEPKEEEQRQRCYLIAVPSGKLKGEVLKSMAFHAQDRISQQLPEVEWVTVYRVEDLPTDGLGVLLQHWLGAAFGEEQAIRWYRRKGQGARLPSDTCPGRPPP
jgi:hypothetical protein